MTIEKMRIRCFIRWDRKSRAFYNSTPAVCQGYGNQSEQKSNPTVSFSAAFENYGDKILLMLDLLICSRDQGSRTAQASTFRETGIIDAGYNIMIQLFPGFFSTALVCGGDEPFAGSLGVADLSSPDELAGASFLAASL
jgi:hypothetical protein